MDITEKNVKSKKKRIARIAVSVILVLVLSLFAFIFFVYNGVLNKINKYDENSAGLMPDPEVGTVSAEDYNLIPTLDPYDFENMFPGEEPIGGEIINIMLVGQDTRNTEYRGLSDTMILISVNQESKRLAITSFMRDSYIDIVGLSGNGVYKDRLNTAYCTGGIKQLGDTLAYNFGIEIDNFVEVDFEAFKVIVDTIGGIDIELTKSEYEHMKYNLKLDVHEGVNHFDGEKALAYARIRKIDSDFNRTERQRTVINEIIKEIKRSGIKDILNLTETFLPLVTTDMSNTDITRYIIQLVPILKDLEIETLRIPIDGTWTGINVGTEEAPKYVIECLDLEANRIAIKQAIGVLEE